MITSYSSLYEAADIKIRTRVKTFTKVISTLLCACRLYDKIINLIKRVTVFLYMLHPDCRKCFFGVAIAKFFPL